MKKHKHNFQFVRIYFKSRFQEPFKELRVATFICECGLLKEVEVKIERHEN